MNILYKTEIMVAKGSDTIGIISSIAILTCLVILCIFLEDNAIYQYFKTTIVLIIITILSVIGIIFNMIEVPSGRYRYEVLINDDYNINEFLDKYNVVDKRGKIWIIEDKEKQ